jgi:hypothetical protein
VKRSWARRTAELHGELSAIATTDLRWWLFAGGAAAVEPWGVDGDYVTSDATPTGDTFIGYRADEPLDPIADAIARARAARTALRELDGELPDQPLAVTLRDTAPSNGDGISGLAAERIPSSLEVAAFAIGQRCVIGKLDDLGLAAQLRSTLEGATPLPWHGATPFVCVSLGEDGVELARHGHRRAWVDGAGPWLGLGRAGGLATVSTCHLVVDGYGHARITGRIAELVKPLGQRSPIVLPRPRVVEGGIPLNMVWRELPYPSPRALPLGYALGRVLHRMAGRRDAKFSPTFQIPIAPGDRDNPLRIRRRVVAGILSVRFANGAPEPYDAFADRAREILGREAAGYGLCTRLLAAARAAPAPLAWKRKSIGATRARWLDRFAEVIGGRGCLSKIAVDAPLPASCAVSSPARLATPDDPFGGCVLTILEDGQRSAITACGSGLAGTPAAANELLDELLALV